jgi:nucleotide-binding universal stress UspA family protein
MSTAPIIHPTDFSDTAQIAEGQALALARALGAELVFVHVAPEMMRYGETPFGPGPAADVQATHREWARRALADRAAAARETGVAARAIVAVGTAPEVIVLTAEAERAQMIVMGTHGRSGLSRFLVGSVADIVLRTAPCPVVLVRARAAVSSAA